MPGDARDRMVASAVKLLAVHGFQATSFSAVLDDSGAPRGSVYHHFPAGKDQLIAAAIDLAGERALTLTESFSGLPAAEIVDAFAGLWRAVLVRSQFQAGCAVLSVTVSADASELVERAAAIFLAWRERLGQSFAAAGVEPARAAGADAHRRVRGRGGAVPGGALAPLDAVAAQLRDLAAAQAAGQA